MCEKLFLLYSPLYGNTPFFLNTLYKNYFFRVLEFYYGSENEKPLCHYIYRVVPLEVQNDVTIGLAYASLDKSNTIYLFRIDLDSLRCELMQEIPFFRSNDYYDLSICHNNPKVRTMLK